MNAKRKVKRSFRDKRALSSALGAIFIVLILMLGFSSWQWQMMQTQEYQDVVAETNSLDQERLSEVLKFQYPGIKDIDGTGPYNFNVEVINMGPIDLEVVRIYLYDRTNSVLTILEPKTESSTYGFEDGYVKAAKSEHKIVVISPIYPDDDYEYELRLVTERGRIFSTLYPMPFTDFYIQIEQQQLMYSHNSMNVKREGDNGFDWKPPVITSEDITSDQLYLRALFTNTRTSTIKLNNDTVLLAQVCEAGPNAKIYFLGGNLIDPATKGWPGTLTFPFNSSSYIYFKFNTWNLPNINGTLTYTGTVGLVGTRNGEFWSGAMMMDSIVAEFTKYE